MEILIKSLGEDPGRVPDHIAKTVLAGIDREGQAIREQWYDFGASNVVAQLFLKALELDSEENRKARDSEAAAQR